MTVSKMDTNFETSVAVHISHNFLNAAYKIYSYNNSVWEKISPILPYDMQGN